MPWMSSQLITVLGVVISMVRSEAAAVGDSWPPALRQVRSGVGGSWPAAVGQMGPQLRATSPAVGRQRGRAPASPRGRRGGRRTGRRRGGGRGGRRCGQGRVHPGVRIRAAAMARSHRMRGQERSGPAWPAPRAVTLASARAPRITATRQAWTPAALSRRPRRPPFPVGAEVAGGLPFPAR